MAEVVLIAVNNDDIASTNQAKYLLDMGGWQQVAEVESFPSYSNQHARMWFLPSRILWQDDLDKRWEQATGEIVNEVIFPSPCTKKWQTLFNPPSDWRSTPSPR